MTMLYTWVSRIKNLFSDIESSSEAVPLATTPDAMQTTADYSVLHWLQSSRQQLEISLPGSTASFQSIVLAVDTARGLLWIDELLPQVPLSAGQWLTLRHHRSGEVLTLRSPLVASGGQFGAAGLALLLPENLEYSPRREFSRIDFQGRGLSTKIRPLGEEPCHGMVINLSPGGMRLALAGNHLSGLHRGSLLPLCQFSLGKNLQIRCQASVKSVRLARTPYRHTQVSLEFVDILPDQRQHLTQYLSHLIHTVQLDTRAA